MVRRFIIIFLLGCSASAERTLEKRSEALDIEGTRVEAATVSLQQAQATLQFTGEVRGERDATLASASGGLIEDVLVKPGQRVKKGKLLVTVDRTLARARLTQIEARSNQAKREWDRLVALGDGVAKADVERAETESIVAKAAAVEAKALLKRSSIVAPFSGTVADVDAEPGEIASPGVPLVHLVSTDPVLVRMSVSDRNVVALEEGLIVDVTAASRPTAFQGRLTQIRAAANPRTRSFLADVSVPNPDGLLLPGMIAQVQAQVSLGEQFVLPQDWIVMQGSTQGVFLAKDGRAVWRDVVLGQVLQNQIVVNGLAEGDQVIFTGQRSLLDGDPIILSRKARCCEAGRPVFE